MFQFAFSFCSFLLILVFFLFHSHFCTSRNRSTFWCYFIEGNFKIFNKQSEKVYNDVFFGPVDNNIGAGPFLKEDVMSLKGLELIHEQKAEADEPAPEPSSVAVAPAARKPAAEKKMVKPKWLKM